ncbi:hypothetical protein EJ08DRAFT_659606 [Tothia fuscella]|uniref:DUF1279 domain-containing protein n=1 Tax=Tothia fuscella TaxID=1048955 RepID=A0A9P4NUJ6_9PEZI|nr:hypothetical protein EJ08DRAFT_659606 [Tothia fuscella]
MMKSTTIRTSRALFPLPPATARTQVIRRVPFTSRQFTILRSNRLSTPSRNRLPNVIRSNGVVSTGVFRQTIRKFRVNGSRNSANPTPNLGSPEPSPSLSQRLRKLSREYGWSALGVYFALSALDFPFCFMAVRLLGTDRIGRWEHAVIGAFWNVVRIPFPDFVNERQAAKAAKPDTVSGEVVEAAREGVVGWHSEMVQAEEENTGSNASVWTQLALAYAIHKSFIFIRVPLTAAVTPKVVKTLRGWGWDIGKRKPKSTSAVSSKSTPKSP